MLFKRDYAIINGDNINGLQILEETKIVDLFICTLPEKSNGNWKRSIEKRIKLANKVMSSVGAMAVFVSNNKAELLQQILDDQVGSEHYVLSCEWEEETLFIYGKANIYDEERVDSFIKDLRVCQRFDKKRENKYGGVNARSTDSLKAIIETFSEDDGEIVDLYAGCGMVGLAVWELNHESKSLRTFTLMEKDENNRCSSTLYPHIHKQSLIYETPFDYVVLENSIEEGGELFERKN